VIAETADVLHIPHFAAEALLKSSDWSCEVLLDRWKRDPMLACQDAGIQMPIQVPIQVPINGLAQPPSTPKQKMLYSENSFLVDEQLGEDELLCEICCDLIEELPAYNLSCRHNFCARCWKNYLYNQIQVGRADYVTCPSSECNILVPMQIIETHVSPRMARKYLKFEQNFFEEPIDTSSVRHCPYPDCQNVVKMSDGEKLLWKESLKIVPPLSRAVECGKFHFFCWDCGAPEAHAPLSCSVWQQWLTKCEEAASTSNTGGNTIGWLINNSRQCPNCQLTLQKTDGCNHVKCNKCHFDFCWVCLRSWKTHSTSSGGYFHCNRYEPMESDVDSQLISSNKFLHYFIRYKNHSNSRAIEKLLLKSVKKKRDLLRSSMTTEVLDRRLSAFEGFSESVPENSHFFESGVWELLNSRTCLCGSYAYGFYLSEEGGSGKRMRAFEMVENDLEEITEHLAQMMSRPYLRIPRRVITQTIQLCKIKRQVSSLFNIHF
jgi:ankyrin repeat/IBR domain-containing protein 1